MTTDNNVAANVIAARVHLMFFSTSSEMESFTSSCNFSMSCFVARLLLMSLIRSSHKASAWVGVNTASVIRLMM